MFQRGKNTPNCWPGSSACHWWWIPSSWLLRLALLLMTREPMFEHLVPVPHEVVPDELLLRVHVALRRLTLAVLPRHCSTHWWGGRKRPFGGPKRGLWTDPQAYEWQELDRETQFFLHESSSWFEIRLHTEFGRVELCKSWEKVMDGFGLWLWFCGFLRKIRLTQLWVELSWVWQNKAICFLQFLKLKKAKCLYLLN